jgi:hypothetical protein
VWETAAELLLDRAARMAPDAGLPQGSLSPAVVKAVPAGLVDQVVALVGKRGFSDWARQVDGTGHCVRPVRLRASFHGPAAARVAAGVAGVNRSLLVRCGNRRATVCPSCSFTYAGDVWHLLAAGIAGERYDIGAQVAAHPMLFVTLTAPSFGAVHGARTSASGQALACHPRRPADRKTCPHGRPMWCGRVHNDDDPAVGEPLCGECFDYEGAAWFNWHAPDLWCRFTITLRRELAARLGWSEEQLRELVAVQYAKVAEFQRRGLVHFHAVIRLDGPGPDWPAPRVPVAVETFTAAVEAAAAHAHLRVPAWRSGRPGLVLRFGAQTDIRPIRPTVVDAAEDLVSGDLTANRVAAYIAKYATKAADDFGLDPRIRSLADADRYGARVTAHVRRLLATLEDLSGVEPRMCRWLHMLGFHGHFTTKSRAFSTTLGRLRETRRRWRSQNPLPGAFPDPDSLDQLDDDQDATESTLVIRWRFDGMGHRTLAEAALAAGAAARAREHRQTRADRAGQGSRADHAGR